MLGVAPGDINTGRKTATPRTRNRRGTKTLAGVAANSGYLFTEMEDDEIVRLLSKRSDLWLLLGFFDEEKEILQLEVSRPVKVSEGKRLIGWQPRILLQNIDFSDGSKASVAGNTAPTSPEIVVEIKRRG